MRLNQAVYEIFKPLGGLRFAKYASRNHPKIIMYHRVSENGESGSISVASFRAQMRIVRQHFNPITLTQLMRENENCSVPENAVVITIDDGYKDFADLMWPIMQEENVPATVFVTTGFVNREIWLWPDKIRYALTNTKVKSINVPGLGFIKISEDRVGAWNKLSDFCLTIQNKEKELLIGWLFRELKVNFKNAAPRGLEAVDWDQLREMVSLGLDVGSHSHTHPILTKLNDQEIKEELNRSRELISMNLGFEPEAFCYPNGCKSDFSDSIKRAVLNAGYSYAVAAYPASKPLSDTLAINRYPGTKNYSLFEKNIYGLSYMREMIRNGIFNE